MIVQRTNNSPSELNACSGCPHPAGCVKVGKCLTELAAPFLATKQFSRWMLPQQARDVEAALRSGRTYRRITSGAKKFGPAIVTTTKFKTHCDAYPEWGSEMRSLAAANAKAADALKGAPKRAITHCKNGHPLSDAKIERRGNHVFRRCLICLKAREKQGWQPSPDLIKKAKKMLEEKMPISHFTGGGRPTYLMKHQSFSRYRREHPEFDRFVIGVISGSNSRAQAQRHQHHKLITGGPAVQNRYYREISDMVPRHLPSYVRDDIVQAIFMALLDQTLRHADISRRISQFVAEHNRMFPTKYAKFGDSALVSLDQVLFEDGNTTRGDTVSRGLWD